MFAVGNGMQASVEFWIANVQMFPSSAQAQILGTWENSSGSLKNCVTCFCHISVTFLSHQSYFWQLYFHNSVFLFPNMYRNQVKITEVPSEEG